MQRIILIETSTALCSVAMAEDGAVTAYRESSAPKAHASLTAVFIQEMLQERGLTLADCDAVCVSMGPGSYTGLRVGVSTAKGLCFGAGKPLIAVGTLDTLVAQAQMADQVGHDGCTNTVTPDQSTVIPEHSTVTPDQSAVIPDLIGDPHFIIPMIDARRMEVYTAVFSSVETKGHSATVISSETEGRVEKSFTQITETAPAIIDENSFAEYLEQGPCLFIGDGAGKCADVIKHPNAHFCQCWPKASAMLQPALAALAAGNFQDVAYFEPFYLKEFVATVSKKKLF
jgi:tRNA threonylcarbamoyladenosine biosynthesis protein TsaB